MIAPLLTYFFPPLRSHCFSAWTSVPQKSLRLLLLFSTLGLIHTPGSKCPWWAGLPCGIIAWHSSTNCPGLDFPASLAPNQQAYPAMLIACPGEAGCSSRLGIRHHGGKTERWGRWMDRRVCLLSFTRGQPAAGGGEEDEMRWRLGYRANYFHLFGWPLLANM